jgi:hypothetical protein
MANALGPYYVQINYHSPDAPHTMTIPTKAWNAGVGVGTFDIWSGGTIAADTMVEGLVTAMLPSFNAGVTFDNWIAYKQLLPSDDPQPLVSDNFTGMTGTDVGGSWAQAVELIITARSSLFGLCKLSLLDAISGDDYSPVIIMSGSLVTLTAEWFADSNGWAARDNGQPTTFLKMTKNLNQKLRKEYRLD